MLKRW